MITRKTHQILPLLVALAMISAAPIAQAQAVSPDRCTDYEKTVSSEGFFQTGLKEAQGRRWETAERCFQEAARGGDREWSPQRPWLKSTRPEVWFNLGLTRAQMRGSELGAMAAFQAYLELAPNSANSEIVKQQITQLHTTLKKDLKAAFAKASALMPAHPYSSAQFVPYERVVNYERSMGANVARLLTEAYLYIGDTAGAEAVMQRFIAPDWRDDKRQHVGSYPQWAKGWPSDPDADLNAYAMSKGDLVGAKAKLNSVDLELLFACTVRDLNATEDLKWISERLRQRDYKNSSYDFSKVALIMLELGDRAFAEDAATKITGDSAKRLQSTLRGELPANDCETASGLSLSGSEGRWWGSGRLYYARQAAIRDEKLATWFEDQKSPSSFDVYFMGDVLAIRLNAMTQTAHRLRVQ